MGNDGLSVVRSHLETVNGLYEEIGAEACVPYPGMTDADEECAHLLELEADPELGPDHKLRPRGATRFYTVRELLDGVGAPATRQAAPPRPSSGELLGVMVTILLAFGGAMWIGVWATTKIGFPAATLLLGVSLALSVFIAFVALRLLGLISEKTRKVADKWIMSVVSSLTNHKSRDRGDD